MAFIDYHQKSIAPPLTVAAQEKPSATRRKNDRNTSAPLIK